MKNSTITIRISEQEKAQLEILAARWDAPMSQLIREAIREYYKEDLK